MNVCSRSCVVHGFNGRERAVVTFPLESGCGIDIFVLDDTLQGTILGECDTCGIHGSHNNLFQSIIVSNLYGFPVRLDTAHHQFLECGEIAHIEVRGIADFNAREIQFLHILKTFAQWGQVCTCDYTACIKSNRLNISHCREDLISSSVKSVVGVTMNDGGFFVGRDSDRSCVVRTESIRRLCPRPYRDAKHCEKQ